jgi:hypothetical protein
VSFEREIDRRQESLFPIQLFFLKRGGNRRREQFELVNISVSKFCFSLERLQQQTSTKSQRSPFLISRFSFSPLTEVLSLSVFELAGERGSQERTVQDIRKKDRGE